MECVRMDVSDMQHYNAVFKSPPYLICSKHWLPVTRRRLWWFSSKQRFPPGTQLVKESSGLITVRPKAQKIPLEEVLMSGWWPAQLSSSAKEDSFYFRCLTRHRPTTSPMQKPGGLEKCDDKALRMWNGDAWSQAPYQYCRSNLEENHNGNFRRLCSIEEEKLQGLPEAYTASMLQLNLDTVDCERRCKSLPGNSWNKCVASFCLTALLGIPAGGRLVDECATGKQMFGHSIVLADACYPHVVQALTPPLWDQYRHVRNSLSEVNSAAQQSCPFLQEYYPSGIPPEGVGPSEEELWAAHCCSNALHIAVRHTGFAVSRSKLIPTGLPAELHCQLGQSLPHPLDVAPVLPADLDYAVRQSLRLDYRAWQRRQMRVLERLFSKLKPLHDFYQKCQSPTAKLSSDHVHPHVLDLLTFATAWPDAEQSWIPVLGVPVVGRIAPVGIFRPAAIVPTRDVEGVLASADEWLMSLLALSRPKAEQVAAIWTKPETEQKLVGILGQWHDKSYFDRYNERWRAMKRFAVWQEGSQEFRVIDNGLSNGANAAMELVERIHTSCAQTSVAIAQVMHQYDVQVPKRITSGQLRYVLGLSTTTSLVPASKFPHSLCMAPCSSKTAICRAVWTCLWNDLRNSAL